MVGTFSMEVSDTETIHDIKTRIWEMHKNDCDLDINTICLKYKSKILKDKQLLCDVGIKSSSTLHLIIYDPTKSINILFISMQNEFEPFNLSFEYNKSVYDMKKLLCKELYCPDEHALILKHGNRLLNDNNQTICGLGIENNDVLIIDSHEMTLGPKIFIKTLTGQSLTLKFDPNKTVAQVKEVIQDQEGVPARQQCLIFGGEKMNNDRYLADYNVNVNCTLRLVITLAQGCFLKGARILTTMGMKHIENIQVGQDLIVCDKTSRRICSLNGLYNFMIDTYVILSLSNEKTIKCTLEHPFYVKNKGLCAAVNLNNGFLNKLAIGDEFVCINEKNGVYLENYKIICCNESISCYTLDLDGKCNNNYFVENVLTHTGFIVYTRQVNAGSIDYPSYSSINVKAGDNVSDLGNRKLFYQDINLQGDKIDLVKVECDKTDKLMVDRTNYVLAGTRIATDSGLKSIDNVTVKDKIISVNFDSMHVDNMNSYYSFSTSTEFDTVDKIIKCEIKEYMSVEFEGDSNVINVDCVSDQLFYSINKRKWCKIQHENDSTMTSKEFGTVCIGDNVLYLNDSSMKLEAKKITNILFKNTTNGAALTCYAIHLHKYHNYFANGVLVHNAITIYVKNLVGKTLTFEVERKNLIGQLKDRIKEKEGIPTEQQRLMFKSQKLANNRRLCDYRIERDSTLHLISHPRRLNDSSYWDNIYVFEKQYKIDLRDCEMNTFDDFKKYFCEIANEKNMNNIRVIANGHQVVVNQNTILESIDWYQNRQDIFIEHKNVASKALIDYPLTIVDESNISEKLYVNRYWDVKRVKKAINVTGEDNRSAKNNNTIHLLYNGTCLDNEQTIADCKVQENDRILAISSSRGGSMIEFMSWVRNSDNRNRYSLSLSSFESSLRGISTIENQSALFKLLIKKGKTKIKKIQSNKISNFDQLSDASLMAIYLWTTNILYKSINSALADGDIKSLKEWKYYLNTLDYGLRQLPYSLGTKLYRGFGGMKNLSSYEKGRIICWQRITAFSKQEAVAVKFMKKSKDNPKILCQVISVDGRGISKISKYETEDEVLFLPYSYFKVIDVNLIKSNDKISFDYFHLILQQVQVPRSPKVVLWVDDNPKNNLKWIYRLEKRGISVIICKTTQECIGVIETYKWILYLKNAQLRIVTDMNRYDNNIAGVELIKKLRNPPHCFDNDILIFSMRDDIAKQHCIDNNVTNNVFVTKYGNVVQKFVFFKQLDDKYKVRV